MSDLYVLLTIDLHDVTPAQRRAFDAEMSDLHWEKLQDFASTTWAARYNDPTCQEVDKQVETDLTLATASAEVRKWNAVWSVSSNAYRAASE